MRVAQDTVAGIAATSALAAAGVPWILAVEPYVHVGASFFAIVGGIFAAIYHWKRLKYIEQKTEKSKKKQDDNKNSSRN